MLFRSVGVPVVVDTKGVIVLLVGARGRSGGAGLLGVGLGFEDRCCLALLRWPRLF